MTAVLPVRDVSGDGSDGPGARLCPVCGSQLLSARAHFCSGRCRMRAHRQRHLQPRSAARPSPAPSPAWPQTYECPECGQRLMGLRRCPDCNLFARRLGPGGLCPHCDEPVLLAELLGQELAP